MKHIYLYIILLALLTLTPVLALEEVPITARAEIRVDKLDENSINLIIIGEDHDEFLNPNSFTFKIRYNSTINNATNKSDGIYILKSTNEILPKTGTWISIHLSKSLGNASELFDIITTCNDMANFSDLWRLCIEQRTDMELQIINQMINRTEYDGLINNHTKKVNDLENQRDTKEATIKEITKEKEELETWNTRWKWLGIIGIGVAGYFLWKYKGWGKRKHQASGEEPKDVSLGGR